MRRLRATKQAWKYKSNSSWVNAIYRHNKKFIDSKLIGKENTFKNTLIEYLGRVTGKQYVDPDNPVSLSPKEFRKTINENSKITIKKALDAMSRSDTFSSFKERQQNAVYKTIHENKEVFKSFRMATGWRQKIDIEKFEWDKKEKVYSYKGNKGTVYIDVNISPKALVYTFMPTLVDGEEKFERKVISEWTVDRM